MRRKWGHDSIPNLLENQVSSLAQVFSQDMIIDVGMGWERQHTYVGMAGARVAVNCLHHIDLIVPNTHDTMHNCQFGVERETSVVGVGGCWWTRTPDDAGNLLAARGRDWHLGAANSAGRSIDCPD